VKKFKRDELVFLLGAGSSLDAGIPTSCEMRKKLEELLHSNENWKQFTSLYNFVKSAINYGEGIKGKFDHSNFNIERLVNTLDELRKSDEHPLFPFIGSWTPKLTEVTRNDFKKIEDFRKKLVEQLSQHWIQLEYKENGSYYSRLTQFQNEYEFPLRIFSLNYDLCIEKACVAAGVERGFGDGKTWDWRIFENEEQLEKNILLYKLHGSVDWVRDNQGRLTYKDSNIPPDRIELIFGTTYKLQYIDPFLFLAYEFRKRTLSDAKLIICVGYGFADEHINGILAQSLKNSDRKILVVAPTPTDNITNEKNRIASALSDLPNNQIEYLNMRAKDFFENKLTLNALNKLFPDEEAPFNEFKSD
jgi:hypothetical protein